MTQTLQYWLDKAATASPDGRAFYAGAPHAALSGERFVRHSPIDGRALAPIARCGAADIDAAVQSARHAFAAGVWRDKAPEERKAVMLEWVRLVRAHANELALLETLEVGKPIGDTLSVDAPGCANALQYYAELADKIYDEIAPTGACDQALVKREPLGVVGAIVPWNYPLIIAAWKLGPALVLGNSVVLKPAEQSSFASILLVRLAHEAGIPAGVLNIVPGFGAEAGEALVKHADVDAIGFTGSTATGRAIMAGAAASNLKRVALELGGKSPQIVLNDCPDLHAAASAIAWSIFYNAGQTCHAGSRVIAQRGIAATLTEKVVAVAASLKRGHPLDPATQIGALVDERQKQKVASYLALAREDGGAVAYGGSEAEIVAGGQYIEPTILANLPATSRVLREEIFGPVVSIIEVDTPAEALAIAQDTEYGLAASIWTSDMSRAHHMSRTLSAGTVWINTYDKSSMATPFGGFKQSGFGRDRSHHALDKYSNLKTVWTHLPRPAA
jgi:gamma-glutamyl-gamma-aminobutyraldehyde dehydrogenase